MIPDKTSDPSAISATKSITSPQERGERGERKMIKKFSAFREQLEEATYKGKSVSLNETEKTTILSDFITRTMQRLQLADPPRVLFHKNKTWAEQNRSFGQFDTDTNTLHVSLPDRHVMDIMRTIAHELTHAKQNEQHDLPDTAGETGSPWENNANAMAGIIMRDMAQENPELFSQMRAFREQLEEATYKGKSVPLNKPMAGDVKKSKVFVDPDGDGKAQKVNFGDKSMTIKKHIPARKKSFRARHNCATPGPKTKARYWSCKAW